MTAVLGSGGGDARRPVWALPGHCSGEFLDASKTRTSTAFVSSAGVAGKATARKRVSRCSVPSEATTSNRLRTLLTSGVDPNAEQPGAANCA